MRRVARVAAPILALCFGACASMASSAQEAGLALDRTMSLGNVAGRIDHLAIDLARKRLFISELGNDFVAVVDLKSGQVIRKVDGLREPQGISVPLAAGLVAIASAGDGSVRLFKADDLSPTGVVELGDDADGIRSDETGRLVVGSGSGGLATLDTATGQKLGDIRLPAHPEAFEIDPRRNRIYVNLPRAYQIGVVDASSGKIVAKWGPWLAVGNFLLALDDAGGRLFSGYRWPASVVAIDTANRKILNNVGACGDADDIFYDGARKRLYVSCGDGHVAIFDAASSLTEVSRILTRKGAPDVPLRPGVGPAFRRRPDVG